MGGSLGTRLKQTQSVGVVMVASLMFVNSISDLQQPDLHESTCMISAYQPVIASYIN